MFDDNFGLTTAQILRNLSSQLGVDYEGGEIKVTRGGKEYLMFIYLPVRGGSQANLVGCPSFFEIKTNIPYLHPFFSIRRSDSTDWVIEHILLMPDYQVGDADFDAKYNVKVNDKDWGSRFFSNNDIKLRISELLSRGFDLIRPEDGNLKVIKYLPIGSPYPTVEMIDNAVEQIDRIISNFPNDYISTATSERNNKNISKHTVKDLVEANHELVFGQTDKKTIQCMWIYVLVLLIVGVFAYGRLIAFMLNPPPTP